MGSVLVIEWRLIGNTHGGSVRNKKVTNDQDQTRGHPGGIDSET